MFYIYAKTSVYFTDLFDGILLESFQINLPNYLTLVTLSIRLHFKSSDFFVFIEKC